jgi:CRISPR system Cascade subunit CasE
MSAWFTRLTLKREDAAISPLIQELAPSDGGAAMAIGHRLLWSVIDSDTRALHDRDNIERPGTAAFLWREAEAGHKFYMLGPRPAEESPFFRIETKPFAPDFHVGDRLAFDLRVNATIAHKGDGESRSRRSDVAMDRMRAEEAAATSEGADIGSRAQRRLKTAGAAIAEWLRRIGERDGFRLVALQLEAYRVETLPRRGRNAQIGVCDVRGTLDVTNPALFLARVLTGFGRAKAFGCGLMLLRRQM